LFSADDQGDPAVNNTLLRKMIEQDKVIAFVGNLGPLSDIPQSKYLNEVGIPLVGGDGIYDEVSATPMVFAPGAAFRSNIKSLAKTVAAGGHKKVGLYYCIEITICPTFGDQLKVALPKEGVEVVAGGPVSMTAVSFAAQCAASKAAGATHILFGTDSASIVRVADNCAQQFNYRPQFSTLSVAVNVAVAKNPNLDGMIAPNGVFPFAATSSPGQALFHKYVNQFLPNLTPSSASALSWVSGMIAVAGSRYLGPTPTTADLLRGLREIKNNDLGGITAPLDFTK
jgi:branched-chain amino acid transport system substrate-binding protein